MKQLTLISTEDIPTIDFEKFIVCNSANGFTWPYLRDFYEHVKKVILKNHGHESGYDLQKIEKECWSCDGTGEFWTGEECWSCQGTGIYAKYDVVLKRYSLNGGVFHIPLSHEEAKKAVASNPIHETIKGLVSHTPPISSILPTQAYFDLLEKYNPEVYLTKAKQLQEDELPF